MRDKNEATAANTKLRDEELIYQLEGRPRFRTAFPLGMQHVLCMFTANLRAAWAVQIPLPWCNVPCSFPD